MKTIPTTTSLLSFSDILKKSDILEGFKVIDLGCGRSLFFLYNLVKLVGKNGEIYAVDILPEVIESLHYDINHYSLNNIKLLQANIEKENKNIKDNSFQTAFLINTLNQVENTLATLKESARILQPGGKLTIVDWLSNDSYIGPKPEQRIDKSQVKKIAVILNLKLVDEFQAGPHHYGLIFSK